MPGRKTKQSEYGQKLVGQVSKAGYVAILDGYKFYCDKMADTIMYGMRYYWQFENCHARLITGEYDVVDSVGDHSSEKAPKDVR
jgi:hypothetical protein